jgi:hypothetical protein
MRAIRIVPLALLALGCSGGGGETAATGGGTQDLPAWYGRVSTQPGFPCDVEHVLRLSCRRCHWEPTENGAPFAMVEWSDVQEILRGTTPIYQAMKQMLDADLMPPQSAPLEPPVSALSAADKLVLSEWLGAGAPESDEVCDHDAP